jgi:short-subunit dehydrogenase
MGYDLHNKNVLITGVSSGIGRQLSLRLIKAYGCKVAGVARNQKKLEEVKEECGENFTAYSIDVSKNENWAALAQHLTENNFYPDVIINNAGIIHPFSNVLDLTEAEIESVINTNYKSLIYCARNMLPLLIKSKSPAMVNVLSAAAQLPVPGMSIYSSSKRAALSFTEALSQEYKEIYIAAVLPGPVKTELYAVRECGGEDRVKVIDGIIPKIGVSARTEAERIIKGILKGKRRIVSGVIAKTMDKAYKKTPSMSVRLAGLIVRLFPLKTFRKVFKKNNTEEDVCGMLRD